MALVSPAPYSIGMANLGIHLVYAAFNRIPGVACHRFFAQTLSLTHRHSPTPNPPLSIETTEPLSRYHVIAFSFSYENDLFNLPNMLRSAGIPLLSWERGPAFPLVIAGGVVATINPEPFANLVDACVLGESEEIIPQLTQQLVDHWVLSRDKDETLEAIGSIPGVYIPSWFQPIYNDKGAFTNMSFAHQERAPNLARRYIPDLNAIPGSMVIHTPNTELKELHLVEISRGCPNRCRFCLIPQCYGPFRYRSALSVIQEAELSPPKWRIGLLGAGCSLHPFLKDICHELVFREKPFSLSSLHVSGFRNNEADCILASGTRTLTLAPEVGDDGKRRFIGKNFTNEQLISVVGKLALHPIKTIKLYFMVGLPEETLNDLDHIIALCVQIQKVIREVNMHSSTIPRLLASVSCFVPKALSAFERALMNTEKDLKAKIQYIQAGLKFDREIRFTSNTPRHAVIQELFARGDRQVSDYLIQASSPGIDWYQKFTSMQKTKKVNSNRYFSDKPLPWDHLKAPLFCNDFESRQEKRHVGNRSKD
ncbi:MAG: radical SAM protein [bacterium]